MVLIYAVSLTKTTLCCPWLYLRVCQHPGTMLSAFHIFLQLTLKTGCLKLLLSLVYSWGNKRLVKLNNLLQVTQQFSNRAGKLWIRMGFLVCTEWCQWWLTPYGVSRMTSRTYISIVLFCFRYAQRFWPPRSLHFNCGDQWFSPEEILPWEGQSEMSENNFCFHNWDDATCI